jgi:hypothetical protein
MMTGIYDLLSSVIIDGKLQVEGLSASGQVSIGDELVCYEDEVVTYFEAI